MEIEILEYEKFGKCISFQNEQYEGVASLSFGPRILSFSKKASGID